MISILAKQLLTDIKKNFPSTDEIGNQQSKLYAQLQVHIESVLQKMNWVSRDEFDSQVAAMERIRERIDVLEKKLVQLEESVNHTPSNL